MSYGGAHGLARQQNLRRLMIPVPVLTPRLSGIWLQPGGARLRPRGAETGGKHSPPTVVERADALDFRCVLWA